MDLNSIKNGIQSREFNSVLLHSFDGREGDEKEIEREREKSKRMRESSKTDKKIEKMRKNDEKMGNHRKMRSDSNNVINLNWPFNCNNE